MKFRITHDFRIDSARYLPKLPKEHPCAQMHGHRFEVQIQLVGELDPEIGWVMDYYEIQEKMKLVLKNLDHRVLNEVPGLENPTTEILTKWIYDQAKKLIPQLVQIQVSESPDTNCIYPSN